MPANRAELIPALAQTSQALSDLTASLDDAALDFRADPSDWTIREILAHLVDDEMYVMRTRLERIVKEDHPDLAPNDEKLWHANRNTNRDALPELLADFDLQRRASLNIMNLLRASDWERQGYQPEYGHFSAEDWLDHWIDHDTTHLRQIESILAAQGVGSGR